MKRWFLTPIGLLLACTILGAGLLMACGGADEPEAAPTSAPQTQSTAASAATQAPVATAAPTAVPPTSAPVMMGPTGTLNWDPTAPAIG